MGPMKRMAAMRKSAKESAEAARTAVGVSWKSIEMERGRLDAYSQPCPLRLDSQKATAKRHHLSSTLSSSFV